MRRKTSQAPGQASASRRVSSFIRRWICRVSLVLAGALLVLPAINTSLWFRVRLPGVGELIASGGNTSFGSEFIASWHDKTWFPAPDTDSFWIFGVGQDCTPLLSGYFCRPFRLRPSGLGFMPDADIVVADWVLFLFSAGLAAYLFGNAPRRRHPGCCSNCGYDLRGNDFGRCPECGTRFVVSGRPPC